MSLRFGVLPFVLILYQLDLSGSQGSYGASVRINSFTLPVGLERVNGSEGERGCGTRAPPLCIVSSGSGGTVSELTDGNFPDPEGTFGHNWAEGFFTVIRGNSSTIEIGFRLERSVVIGEVQLSLLNCPAWGIGAPNIALYGNINSFPEGFNVSLSTQLGNTTAPIDTPCTVHTHSITNSIEVGHHFRAYFLVFNYETTPNLTWLFLGEVQFFVALLPLPTSAALPPMTPSNHKTLPTTALASLQQTVSYSSAPPTTTVKSDLSPFTPWLIIAGCGAVVLCVLIPIICASVCCIRKRRKTRSGTLEMKVASVNGVYDDIVNFQGGSGEEVINSVYESAATAMQSSTGNSVSNENVPVRQNRAYATSIRGQSSETTNIYHH